MPCSLLLALGLLTAPDCCSSLTILAEHSPQQWVSHQEKLITFGNMLHHKDGKPNLDSGESHAPAMAEKPSSVALVPAIEISEPDQPDGPAIAERAPEKRSVVVMEGTPLSPATALKISETKTPVVEIPMDLTLITLDSNPVIDHSPAIAERSMQTATENGNPEDWQQIAQAWSTLPPHVKSEILRLVQNAN